MAKQSVAARSPVIGAWLVAGAVVLCAPVASRAINSVTPASGAVNQGVVAGQTAAAPRYSPGIADIVKMVDAKVDAEVIKTYIKNSPTAYNPSAAEIIALKDRGVGPEILTALLQRGAEVRGQWIQAGTVAPQTYPGAANPYPPAPDYGYTTPPVYPNDVYSYPVDSYVYPGYNYGWRDYGYCWPYFWPSCYFGGYPYRGYGGYHYPYWRGNHGYSHSYGGYYAHGGRPVPFAGHGVGIHSFASGGRPAAFASHSGGFRGGGGFGGHAVSFASHVGGGGGHASGRGR